MIRSSSSALLIAAIAAVPLHAQEFPSKPIRIMTADAGGGADFAARTIAQGITSPLGQPVIVDNRGIISAELVGKAPGDGYTLVLFASPLWLGPLMQKANYDPVHDFAPVTLVASSPLILTVHPTIAAGSVKELIALARGKPGALNYASASAGGATHLAAELFKAMANADIVRVNYKGAAPALNALVGGEVQLMFANALSVTPHVKTGRLKALAITSAQPSALAPGMPTVAAGGLQGYETVEIFGVLAPAATPAAVVGRLNKEMVQVLSTAESRDRFLSLGSEVIASTPAQFSARLHAEMDKWGKLIKQAGIRVD